MNTVVLICRVPSHILDQAVAQTDNKFWPKDKAEKKCQARANKDRRHKPHDE
jgi:hypothetical protein